MSRPRAIVTGASRGLGAAFAKALAASGHDLILTARDAAALDTVAKAAQTSGAQVQTLRADLEQAADVARVAEAALTDAPETLVLVNNAGFGLKGAFAGSDEGATLGQIDVNVRALTHLAHALSPHMIENRRGGMINVASIAAFAPGPGMAVYFATKAYVVALSEALWKEMRPHGVTVTALCPGVVFTGFQDRAGIDPDALKRTPSMTPDAVVEAGLKAFFDGKRLVTPGAQNKAFTGFARFAPKSWTLSALARAQMRD